ncbi:hypothetical protein HAX54_001981 [Datura stramonium]|uniref:Uncharacterized protein n=1 Tax=Datura stramonium TaxID=4076 RepID=A0ABS8T4D4_DATST|nr:hypothetical protein [Datura stramonium]
MENVRLNEELKDLVKDNVPLEEKLTKYMGSETNKENSLTQNNLLCTHCDENGHYKDTYEARITVVRNNVRYTRENAVSRETDHSDDLEAGELVKLQSTPGEGPDARDKPSGQADKNRGGELKSSGQELDTLLDTPMNDSRGDISANNTNHYLKEGSNDEEAPDPETPINQQGQDPSAPRVSNWKHRTSHPLDNIISSFDQGLPHVLRYAHMLMD